MNRKREDTIMKSKKILAVLMAAGMTLSLAACGSSSDSTDKSADNGSDSAAILTPIILHVGICFLSTFL